MNKNLVLLVLCVFFVGCAIATSYTDPISYDVEIGKTTKSEIVSTFGLSQSSSSFGPDGEVLTHVIYGCNGKSALTVCVTKKQGTICTPCGVPVNFNGPYDGVTFDFTNDILTNVGYFTSSYNNHPMITSNWVTHAPKEKVGNYQTQKITR